MMPTSAGSERKIINHSLVHLGVIVTGLSVAAFLVSAFLAGSAILAIGVAIAVIGTRRLRATEIHLPTSMERYKIIEVMRSRRD